MRSLTAFTLADLRNITRESLMLYLILVPIILIAVVRLGVPAIIPWAADRWSIDLRDYYPFIAGMFLFQIPAVFGFIVGLLVLDERDDGTLLALRVTPVSMSGYILYRAAFTLIFGSLSVFLTLLLSGLTPPSLLPAAVPIAIAASALAPLLALLLATLAGNKLEGLALAKGFGVLIIGPLVGYFAPAAWQPLLWIFPTYWPAKAYWAAAAGQPFWPYLLVAVLYQAALIGWLQRRFAARLTAT